MVVDFEKFAPYFHHTKKEALKASLEKCWLTTIESVITVIKQDLAELETDYSID